VSPDGVSNLGAVARDRAGRTARGRPLRRVRVARSGTAGPASATRGNAQAPFSRAVRRATAPVGRLAGPGGPAGALRIHPRLNRAVGCPTHGQEAVLSVVTAESVRERGPHDVDQRPASRPMAPEGTC